MEASQKLPPNAGPLCPEILFGGSWDLVRTVTNTLTGVLIKHKHSYRIYNKSFQVHTLNPKLLLMIEFLHYVKALNYGNYGIFPDYG